MNGLKKNEGKIIGLAHIGLFVSNIERTKEFYTKLLGFDISYETILPSEDGSIKVCFLTMSDLCIEAIQFPKSEKLNKGCVDHFALQVKNIDIVKKQLELKGIRFEEENITYAPNVWNKGSKWILFRGPDNERLELNEIL